MTGSTSVRQARLEALRRQMAKAQSFSARSDEQSPLGIREIDACLNGALLRGALHEVTANDHRSLPAAVGFLLAMTANFTSRRDTILWPTPKAPQAFGQPYAPGLRCLGLDPARVLFVRCATERECLWAMEEGLRLGGIAAVVGVRGKATDLTASRRLQLAAEQSTIPVLLLRGHNDRAQSAAVTRWRVSPAPSARDDFGFFANARWTVALDYARGGKTGEWAMEWNHDAVSLRLATGMGDRAAGENRAA